MILELFLLHIQDRNKFLIHKHVQNFVNTNYICIGKHNVISAHLQRSYRLNIGLNGSLKGTIFAALHSFHNYHLSPYINRELAPVCSFLISPLWFSICSAAFPVACHSSLFIVILGCMIQTLTCGGACAITRARIAQNPVQRVRTNGQPLISTSLGCCMRHDEQMSVFDRKSRVCVLLSSGEQGWSQRGSWGNQDQETASHVITELWDFP